MNEQPLSPQTWANYLFSLLGGLCAIVVGIAFFGESQTRQPASAEKPAVMIDWQDVRSNQSILD